MPSSTPQCFGRNYDGALADLRARLAASDPHGTGLPPVPAVTTARMQLLADLLWDHFGAGSSLPPGTPRISWVGFYLPVHNDADEPAELILGPRRDKPACSPIALHGACGRAWLTRTALVITDVANLGGNYVACDPRDRAELVIPCLDETGHCHAVLDFDACEPNAFSADDVAPVTELLRTAGLTSGTPASLEVI